MAFYLFVLLVVSFAVEALTEIVIKSEVFRPFRELIFKLGPFFQKLFTCGYCFSVWVALAAVSAVPDLVLPLSGVFGVNMLLTILVVHRLSNVIHNVIDKWTDKYYSMSHVNSGD
ncbi:MAG: hypothetical protein GF334_01600 [Candidatus Altiarchaeales archaeon]|nr:hypothetical protein [Candidatus Altiarchaeales archaeon]